MLLQKALRSIYFSERAFRPINSLKSRAMASARIVPPASMTIELTDTEIQVCTLLDECTQKLQEEKGVKTSCRIAGGWVRDKLLGSQSNDIDIALENIMGVPFAEHFVAFVSTQKHLPVKGVTKIESNPDQSKHLETARTTVLDTELDFVNLRSEEYAEDSRIPTGVAFGTPLQDALRRDITINALFYNVHSRSVEDFTEKGLDDLRNGIIRTPLSPMETFHDDPLRVIRCIRFASRFGFDFVPELRDAALHPEIQQAIALKISRERVGEELDKMMKGRDPLRAIQLIHDLSLYSSIFMVPSSIASTFSTTPTPSSTAVAAATVLQHLLNANPSSAPFDHLPTIHKTLISSVTTPGTRARLFLAAALTPYRGISYTDSKGKSHPATEPAIREGTRLGAQNHYLDGIPALFSAAELLKSPDPSNGKLRVPTERVAIGLLLREKCVHNPNTGSHWTTSILFSLIQELAPLYDFTGNKFDEKRASEIIHIYNNFTSKIEDLGLETAADAKPLIDGRRVVLVMGANKPGVWTGQVLAKVMEWQLGHPNGTPEECETWLKAEQEAGRIIVEENVPSQGKRSKGPNNDSVAKKAKR